MLQQLPLLAFFFISPINQKQYPQFNLFVFVDSDQPNQEPGVNFVQFTLNDLSKIKTLRTINVSTELY